ncbi:hypothetical protein, partial [Arthrobacter echini]|uniref:hypothetical protein n=1 Tax=Arthrobacter echini TaxID=1529066 RepID=UPI001B3B6792
VERHFLTDSSQAELIEPAKRGQVRGSKGSVGHVEVFQMGSVRTSIIGGPRPLPQNRRAHPAYTLHCDEPQKPDVVFQSLSSVERELLDLLAMFPESTEQL